MYLLLFQIKHRSLSIGLSRGTVVRTKECQMARKAKVFKILLQHGADVTITPMCVSLSMAASGV